MDHPKVGPVAAIDLAEAYADAGDPTQAREVLEWVWELNLAPYSPFAALPLARLLAEAGETEQARRRLQDVAADPNTNRVDGAPDVRFALAPIQARQGLEEAACKNYELALADGVHHPANVRRVLASLQAKMGAWREALKNYELVWQAGDDEFDDGLPDVRPDAAGMLAHLYKQAGDLPAARRAAQYMRLSMAAIACPRGRCPCWLCWMRRKAGAALRALDTTRL